VEQIGPGPGHPRADRADGAADQFGGLGVLQAQHLGEHERLPPVGIEPGHEVVQFDALGGRGLDAPLPGDTGVEATAS